MVTLRTFTSPVEAALAKSRLDDRNIFSALADENANRLGGAPFAMPIRLLVAEEQLDEARRVLSEDGAPLPDSPEAAGGPVLASEPGDSAMRALEQTRGAIRWMGLGIFALLALTIYLVLELPARTDDPWAGVHRAFRRNDYATALKLVAPIVAAHPRDYYGHEYLGTIYRELGNLERAEKEYERAIELLPPQGLQQKLDEVRKRRAQQGAAEQASATPPP